MSKLKMDVQTAIDAVAKVFSSVSADLKRANEDVDYWMRKSAENQYINPESNPTDEWYYKEARNRFAQAQVLEKISKLIQSSKLSDLLLLEEFEPNLEHYLDELRKEKEQEQETTEN
jgi:hypothetical protein